MRLFYLLAAFLLFFSGPARAADPSPQPSNPPAGAASLKIVGCSLEYNSMSGVAAKLHIDFMNLNAKPVTHIRFRVETGFTTFAVMDLGTFAPNMKIHHDLDPPAISVAVVRTSDGGGLLCAVDAFTLTDGYTWVSPQLRQDLQNQQTQHPNPQP